MKSQQISPLPADARLRPRLFLWWSRSTHTTVAVGATLLPRRASNMYLTPGIYVCQHQTPTYADYPWLRIQLVSHSGSNYVV